MNAVIYALEGINDGKFQRMLIRSKATWIEHVEKPRKYQQ